MTFAEPNVHLTRKIESFTVALNFNQTHPLAMPQVAKFLAGRISDDNTSLETVWEIYADQSPEVFPIIPRMFLIAHIGMMQLPLGAQFVGIVRSDLGPRCFLYEVPVPDHLRR